jgi:ATP-dependent DNA helicase RecQ
LDELVLAVKTGTEVQRVAQIRLLLDAGKIKTDGKNYYL